MNLREQVNKLEAEICRDFSDSKIEKAISTAAINTARIEAWKDQLNLSIPILDEASFVVAVKQIRDQLLALVALKQKAPLEVIGSQAEIDATKAALELIGKTINAYNLGIQSVAVVVGEFKRKLAGANAALLKAEMNKLEAAQRHNLPEVKVAVAEYKTAETERKRLDNEKIRAREQLDTLMQTTLQQYQASINDLLTLFGAEFSIEQLKPTYLGSGEPRTEYGLNMRNKSVKLGSRADMTTGCSFATTLSEADKRTLAFSFLKRYELSNGIGCCEPGKCLLRLCFFTSLRRDVICKLVNLLLQLHRLIAECELKQRLPLVGANLKA
jgi:wobble nucleotide-excising tRNase